MSIGSWPRFLAKSFAETWKGILLGLTAAVAVFVAGLLLIPHDRLFTAHAEPGSFYQIVPYVAMLVPALILFCYGGGGDLVAGERSLLVRAR